MASEFADYCHQFVVLLTLAERFEGLATAVVALLASQVKVSGMFFYQSCREFENVVRSERTDRADLIEPAFRFRSVIAFANVAVRRLQFVCHRDLSLSFRYAAIS